MVVGVGTPGLGWGLNRTWASAGRILQKDEGLKVLLSIPDSAKVVAFKPKHPGLWSIKVGTLARDGGREQLLELDWPLPGAPWGRWGLLPWQWGCKSKDEGNSACRGSRVVWG